MKRILFCLALSLPGLVFGQAAQFKGWHAIDRELTTRIGTGAGSLKMDKYIPAEGLEAFLGTWALSGSERLYQNGLANSLNLLIWQLSLTSFGKDVAKACVRSDSRFNANFRAVLSDICQWPNAQAKDEKVLLEYWFALMGYNAPEDEYKAWRDFFLSSSYKSKTASEAVEAMTLAISMNPYFLLKR